jgi:acetyl esterase/lipase
MESRLETRQGVTYAMVADRPLHMNLAWPSQPPVLPMPVVVWFHGGGWCGGDHRGEENLSLARRGYFTANVEYRLSQEAVFPAQIHDCKAALRYLRANAAEHGLDPDRIGVWGASAGGHLAALVGTAGWVRELEGDLGNAEYSSAVQAVVDICGPSNLTALPQSPAAYAIIREIVDQFLGGPLAERLDLARAASPVTHVRPTCPPFMIVHGDQDDVVPIGQSEQLHAALTDAGVESALVRVRGGGHGFGPEADPTPERLEEMIFEFFDRHLRRPRANL